MDADTHHAVLRIAASVGAYVLADEVYRGIDLVWSNKQNAQHTQGSGQAEGLDMGESAAQLDAARGISVGSMSKAFAMAGVRLGWIVGPPEVLEQVSVLHGKTTTHHIYLPKFGEAPYESAARFALVI